MSYSLSRSIDRYMRPRRAPSSCGMRGFGGPRAASRRVFVSSHTNADRVRVGFSYAFFRGGSALQRLVPAFVHGTSTKAATLRFTRLAVASSSSDLLPRRWDDDDDDDRTPTPESGPARTRWRSGGWYMPLDDEALVVRSGRRANRTHATECDHPTDLRRSICSSLIRTPARRTDRTAGPSLRKRNPQEGASACES